MGINFSVHRVALVLWEFASLKNYTYIFKWDINILININAIHISIFSASKHLKHTPQKCLISHIAVVYKLDEGRGNHYTHKSARKSHFGNRKLAQTQKKAKQVYRLFSAMGSGK